MQLKGRTLKIQKNIDSVYIEMANVEKQTSTRYEQTDEAIRLVPPVKLTLESAVEFINDDELVEITPHSIRLRKRYLKDFERKRAARAVQNEFGEKDE